MVMTRHLTPPRARLQAWVVRPGGAISLRLAPVARRSAHADPCAHGNRRQQRDHRIRRTLQIDSGSAEPDALDERAAIRKLEARNLLHAFDQGLAPRVGHTSSPLEPHPGPGAFGEVMQIQQSDGPASGSSCPIRRERRRPWGLRGVSGRGTPLRTLRQRAERRGEFA